MIDLLDNPDRKMSEQQSSQDASDLSQHNDFPDWGEADASCPTSVPKGTMLPSGECSMGINVDLMVSNLF